MKTTKPLLISFSCIWMTGCILFTPAPDETKIKPIQQVYSDRLAQIYIGIPVSEFRTIFPEAYPGGQNGDVTAYEITLKQIVKDRRRMLDAKLGLYTPQDLRRTESLWFYFHQNKLLKWGRAQDWPDKPDVIIEKRIKNQ